MKKTIIAGAASAVLAAMPVMGVFAENQNAFIDTVEVTVNGTCSIVNSATGKWEETFNRDKLSATIAAGHSTTLGDGNSTPKMNISCNTDSGTWTLSAAATTNNDESKAALVGSGSADGEYIVSSNAPTADGDTSRWSFKLATGDSAKVTVAPGYGTNFVEIPTSPTTVASGNAANVSETSAQVYPIYEVYVSSTQAAGVYTGNVKYTLAYSE